MDSIQLFSNNKSFSLRGSQTNATPQAAFRKHLENNKFYYAPLIWMFTAIKCDENEFFLLPKSFFFIIYGAKGKASRREVWARASDIKTFYRHQQEMKESERGKLWSANIPQSFSHTSECIYLTSTKTGNKKEKDKEVLRGCCFADNLSEEAITHLQRMMWKRKEAFHTLLRCLSMNVYLARTFWARSELFGWNNSKALFKLVVTLISTPFHPKKEMVKWRYQQTLDSIINHQVVWSIIERVEAEEKVATKAEWITRRHKSEWDEQILVYEEIFFSLRPFIIVACSSKFIARSIHKFSLAICINHRRRRRRDEGRVFEGWKWHSAWFFMLINIHFITVDIRYECR